MEYDYDYDLGRYGRAGASADATAQLWCDRGMNWLWGFHHEEAIACFKRAVAADPGCALAHWGMSYAYGPNYNVPWEIMDPESKVKALGAARAALAKARDCEADGALAALIAALEARYPQDTPMPDHAPWDHAFAEAMRKAAGDYPEDLDVQAIFADALLNLTPWKMWDLFSGAPAPQTEEARAVLERGLARPGGMDHPGLTHLFVHLMEMSPEPEAALKVADRLRTLVPDAGHLVHMPTHIDILCGHYENVVRWNEAAVAADLKEYARSGGMNFYTGYRQHNYHFVIYGAMFLGQIGPALAAEKGLRDTTPEEMLHIQSPPMADFFESYLSMLPHILIRFGRWEDILALPYPEDRALHITQVAFIDYARGVALSALGRVAEAEEQVRVFEATRAEVPETRLLHNNTIVDLLTIGAEMLAGELAYRKDAHDAAFAHLRRAIALEDTLNYDEPWGWMQPVRHALGALCLEQGRIAEAEQAFREDLGLVPGVPRACQHPDNVWALRGLFDCMMARGAEPGEVAPVEQRLRLAEARADQPIRAACACALKAGARAAG